MTPERVVGLALATAMLWVASGRSASAAEWFVAAGETGTGSSAAPFGRIQDALNVAQSGDTVTVGPGIYVESLQTVRDGLPSAPIRVRARDDRGTVLVTFRGPVLRVNHRHFVVERLVFDGQYALADTVSVASTGHFLALQNVEVRRSTFDLIDIRDTQGVVIEDSLIHHALNAQGGRRDAHAIAAGAARDLIIRNTEIHTFSGDGIQIDPGRSRIGWERVTIERSRIWLAPLPEAENGFPAGTVPGENAVDTKVNPAAPRATLTIRDTIASGFAGGLIGNMAAFNLKENVNAAIERVTVFDSDIAFRLRGAGRPGAGGAYVTIMNAVIYNARRAFRYEDNIRNLKIWNSTIGRNVARIFQDASSDDAGLEVRNLLVLGTALPPEAAHASNRVAGAEAFVDADAHDYALAADAVAIDAGITMPSVTTDRIGTRRPQGAAFDVGAYEHIPATGRQASGAEPRGEL